MAAWVGCERGQTTAEYMGMLLVVGMVIAAVASSGIDRLIMAGVQQAICDVAAVSDSDCGQTDPREGGAGSRAGEAGTEGSPSDIQTEGSEDGPAVARLDLGETKRGALPAIQPAGLGQAARPASGQAGGATNCFASSTGDCGPADEPPDGAYLPPERYEAPGDEVGDAIIDGTGELSGYNDADDAVEAFGDGELFSGLISGILASPFGKVPKAADKAFDGLRGLFRRPSAREAPSAARGGESAASAYGRKVHREYDYGPGFEKEFRGLPSGRRPDAVNPEERVVVELKPNNPAAMRRGQRQLDVYRRELEKEFGGTWQTRLETYDRSRP